MIYIREDLKPLFCGERRVANFLKIDGQVFKQFPTRRTLKFRRGGRDFFIKSHGGVGWKLIIRKLLSLHIPVVSAKTEWHAIQALEAIGVNTMKIAAYGEEGINPATRKSFIVTEALNGTQSLEKWAPSFIEGANSAEKIRLKRALIRKIAEISRRLHSNGINHRDYYLCHFLLDVSAGRPLSTENINLYLIDLHRMQIRKRTPERWAVKDIAGVLFSSMDLGLTSADFIRFMQHYRDKSLRVILRSERAFWNKVLARAIRLYRQQHGAKPKLPPMILRQFGRTVEKVGGAARG
ncbi:MAG: lipopolysaccharide core heptose(I) kinase RfaP [Acidiferrobacterales bacterium]